MTEFEKTKLEIVKFMRGKYRLDEVAGKYYDIDCLKFRQGKKNILSINIHEEHYDFQLILGKKEREVFDARRDEFYNEINVDTDAICVFIIQVLLEILEKC